MARVAPLSTARSLGVQTDNFYGLIRLIDLASATVSTLVGTPLTTGLQDGVGSNAVFGGPNGIAMDTTETFALVVRRVVRSPRVDFFMLGTDRCCRCENSFCLPSFPSRQADTGNNVVRFVSLVATATPTYCVPPSQSATASTSSSPSQSSTSSATYTPTQSVSASATGALTGDEADTVCAILYVGGYPTFALSAPWGIALEPSGAFALVTEEDAHRVRKITAPLSAAPGVTTLAGSDASPGDFGYIDDVGTAARFYKPRGIAMNAAGTVAVVADSFNGLIRRIDVTTGAVTTVAGRPTTFGRMDGIGAIAMFGYTAGIAMDAAGTVAVVVSADA